MNESDTGKRRGHVVRLTRLLCFGLGEFARAFSDLQRVLQRELGFAQRHRVLVLQRLGGYGS